MGANLSVLRARVREELNDTVAPYLWADQELNDLLCEASDWYSFAHPAQKMGRVDVGAGDRTFSLPAGIHTVRKVELPAGRVLPYEADMPLGDSSGQGERKSQSWCAYGGLLYIRNGAAGVEVGPQKLLVAGDAYWPPPAEGEGTESPVYDDRLLVLWAAAEACRHLDVRNAKLGRELNLGAMALGYQAALDREEAARRRKAACRTLQG